MDLTDSIHRGVERLRAELGRGGDWAPGPTEAASAYKYALADLLTREFGDQVLRRSREGGLSRLQLLDRARELLPGLLQTGILPGISDWMLGRVVVLAADTLLSEPMAPELLLSPEPVALPPLPIHALIFSAFPHVTHELYPLMVDAYVADVESHGWRSFQVVGVHEQWLSGSSFSRAILYNEQTQGLLEAVTSRQMPIATAQVLALNLNNEAPSQRRIEAELGGVPVLNPLAGAEVLDDKARTAEAWEQAGLPIPPFRVLKPEADAGEIRQALHELGPGMLIVKPVGGTEGKGVSRVDSTDVGAVREALRAGATIVSQERGSARYASSEGPVPFTLRLNVCWDGSTARAESGYAQVARAPEGIASAGRGGRIVHLDELWAGLCDADGTIFIHSGEDWARVVSTAESGVQVLARILGPEMPALVGIDLLLDRLSPHGLLPLLLEANPRPAGMSHCRFISPDGPTDVPGVTLRLWDRVWQLQSQ